MYMIGGTSLTERPSAFIWRFDLDTGLWMPVLFGVPMAVGDAEGTPELVVHATYAPISFELLILRETQAGSRRFVVADVNGVTPVRDCTFTQREGIERERIVAGDDGVAYLVEYGRGVIDVTRVTDTEEGIAMVLRGTIAGDFADDPFNTPHGPRLPLIVQGDITFEDVADVELSPIQDRCQ